jgi:hypothetical protein
MASLSELRTGIATNLATITGLRTAATIPDNPNPPVAIVTPDGISYDSAFGRGMQEYRFTVTVLVGLVSERSSQNKIDAYCSSTGSSSIKLAVESDKTLDGAAFDVRVSEMRTYSSVSVGDVKYLGAEFIVLCYAD